MIMKIRSSRGAAQRLCWVTQFAWWGFLQHYRTLIPLLLQKGGWQALHSVRQPPLLKLDCIMRMALSSSYSFLYSFLNGMHFLFSFYPTGKFSNRLTQNLFNFWLFTVNPVHFMLSQWGQSLYEYALQLNEYEADPHFLQISQNLMSSCLLISVFFPVRNVLV